MKPCPRCGSYAVGRSCSAQRQGLCETCDREDFSMLKRVFAIYVGISLLVYGVVRLIVWLRSA